ncbi:hypothetical protein [Escherichia coli]|uniref:hypothetical protein n=1 Tax=Escherichia coli TaxID=562 RepID=UPI001BC89A82|nr:hypothetical protein [Escherichia coli]
MKTMKAFFIFLLALMVCQAHAVPTKPNTESSATISVGASIDRSVNTTDWHTIGTIDIASQPQHDGCGFLCSSPQTVSVNHGGIPFGRATWWNYGSDERTVDTSDGELKIRFVYNNVTIRAVLVNTNNTRQFLKEFSYNAAESDREVTPANACGNISGCTYSFRAGMISGTIDIQVYLPTALSKKTYNLNNINIGHLVAMAAPSRSNLDFVKTEKTSYLTLAGSISVPDRCYMTIDDGTENPSSQSIDFGEIDAYPQSDTVLKTKTLTLKTSCSGVKGGKNVNVASAIKLEPAGDTTIEDTYKFRLSPATDASVEYGRYLGIVANYDSTGNCNENINSFKSGVYKHMGFVVVGNIYDSVKKSYPLIFSLCAFGDDEGRLTPGDYTGAIKLTMRWAYQ